MIRAYLADGVLAETAQVADATIKVDVPTWTYLHGILGSDHCYLVIGGIEPVRVVGLAAPNVVLVTRRIETNNRSPWPAGTQIKYELTNSELVDATQATVLSLTITGQLTSLYGTDLHYPVMTIGAVGGISVSGSATGGVWRVEDIPANTGCECGDAPAIPLVYEKLRVYDAGYRTTDDGSFRRYA